MAFDTARGELLFVGGGIRGGKAFNETWIWDGTRWSLRVSATVPTFTAQGSLSVAYDERRQRAVLVLAFVPVQTWEWDAVDWTLHSPAIVPSVRGGTVVYDGVSGRVVLFGGLDQFAVYSSDTWSWDGTTWTKLLPSVSPSPRIAHSMVYDSARQRVLLFGGGVADQLGSRWFNDTWEWNGMSWRQLQPTRSPPPRAGHTMAYDAARDRVVLFGGSDGSRVLDDTWEWYGSDWRELRPATAIPEKTLASMAYDPVRRRVVLFGGVLPVGGNEVDLWEWDGIDWTYRGPKSVPAPTTGPALAYDEARNRTVLFGGNRDVGAGTEPLSAELWEWDGAAWTLRFPWLPRPAARVGHALAYDTARQVSVLFGGYPLVAPTLGDTWEWDGASWREHTGPGPLARGGHALAYDTARGRIVLFGGQSNAGVKLDDTWLWNGTAWTRTLPAVSPSARAWHALAYDRVRERVVLFGGDDTAGLSDETWEWDGAAWTLAMPPSRPSARRLHALVFDADRQRVVLSGGLDAGGVLGDTKEWDGGDWIAQAPSPSLPARYSHGTAYDGARRQVVSFGGGNATMRLGEIWLYEPAVRGAASAYGAGCAGAQGTPTIAGRGAAILGSRGFTVQVGSLPPQATVALGLGALPRATPLPFGCTLLVDIVTCRVATAGATGIAEVPLPVPLAVALRGARLFAQGFTLDPQGAFFGIASFTPGLAVVIGD